MFCTDGNISLNLSSFLLNTLPQNSIAYAQSCVNSLNFTQLEMCNFVPFLEKLSCIIFHSQWAGRHFMQLSSHGMVHSSYTYSKKNTNSSMLWCRRYRNIAQITQNSVAVLYENRTRDHIFYIVKLCDEKETASL